MKIFARYLKYRLETTAVMTLVFSVFSIIVMQICISNSTDSTVTEHNGTSLAVLSSILGVVCSVMPIFELSCFKNRRNLDALYFFPLSRNKSAAVHFLSGFIQVTIIYTSAFLWSLVYLAIKAPYFELRYMLPFWLLSLLFGFCTYSFFAFIFTEANTVTDGIIFCLMWIFALYVFFGYIFNVKNILSWLTIYAPINNLTVMFIPKIESISALNDYYIRLSTKLAGELYMFAVHIGTGVLTTIGFFVSFKNKRAENIGEVSESVFGYKLLIPIYSLSLLCGISEAFFRVFVIFATFIGYIIYRRSFKLPLKDVFMIAGIFSLSAIVRLIA